MPVLESKKSEVEKKTRIREFVFGIQDGLISTLGLLAGIQTVFQDQRSTVITGVAALVTGGLSMATGSYLSSKSQKEVFEKELIDQEIMHQEEPYLAQEGLLESLTAEGMDRESSYKIVKILNKEKKVFLQTFQEKVLGLGTAELDKPFQAAMVMFSSFAVGSFVPMFPYLFLYSYNPLLISVILSATALFFVGFYKGVLASKPRFLSGFEFVVVAFGSAGAGWAIGKLFDQYMG